MDGVIGFLLGIFVGSSFGVFTMALLIAAKWEDRQLAGNKCNHAVSGFVWTMQDKMIFSDGDQAVPPHPAEFLG